MNPNFTFKAIRAVRAAGRADYENECKEYAGTLVRSLLANLSVHAASIEVYDEDIWHVPLPFQWKDTAPMVQAHFIQAMKEYQWAVLSVLPGNVMCLTEFK